MAALIIAGCSAGQVVPPFNPKDIKPDPYNPEVEWDERTDSALASIQALKNETGQTQAPSSAAAAAGTAGARTASTTTGTTPGGTTTPGTVVPGPAPGPAPAPARIPLPTDAVYGVVRDRIEGGVIPNALVTLTERRGATVATFITNAAGEYSFLDLQLGGYYNVTAVANGYSPCPLSSVDLTYMGIPVLANLELAYGMPWQVIEGGNFNKIIGLGNVRYRVSDGSIADPTPIGPNPAASLPVVSQSFETISLNAGGVADALQKPFYSSSTQQTYNALYFEDIHNDWYDLPGNIYTDPNALAVPPAPFLQYQVSGSTWDYNTDGEVVFSDDMFDLSNYSTGTSRKDYRDPGGLLIPYLYDTDIEPWAEYDFVVPAPIPNKYSYDGMWVSFPENFMVNSDGVWSSGGSVRYWYYNFLAGGWYSLENSKENSLGYIGWGGIDRNTGQVSVRAAAYDENPFVITSVKLAYDYRKDVAAPTLYETPYAEVFDTSGFGDDGSYGFVIKPQEGCFATINVSGPSGYTNASSGIFYRGSVGYIYGDAGCVSGPYSYTITLTDQPNNTATYGPYGFFIN